MVDISAPVFLRVVNDVPSVAPQGIERTRDAPLRLAACEKVESLTTAAHHLAR
jgi:hypothetical protein